MKKIFVLTAFVFAVFFAACSADDGDTNNNSSNTDVAGNGTTKLTISNQSFSDLTAVQWNGVAFGDEGVCQHTSPYLRRKT